MSSQPTPDSEHVPVLADFLSSVPPALTFALVRLAPCISACKSAVQFSSWRTTWYHSWLALASWWAVCLLLDKTLKKFLPFVIFGFVALTQRRQKKHSLPEPTTENILRNVVTDLTIIQSHLPHFPSPSIAISKLFRAIVIIYVPYLVLSFLVSFRVICAIIGTVILTWRAPWAAVLRATIWRSAWFRWSVYKAWSIISGEPMPVRIMSSLPAPTSSTPVQSLRFLFTVYENQRWWMALDWTAALLPGERPSWCSASQHPLLPPNAFTLPDNTTVYLKDENGGRLKRTATWKWEEPEWRVIVRKDGGGVSRVERPLPSVKDENANSSRLLKAAGRLRDSTTTNGNTSAADNKGVDGNSNADHAPEESNENAEEEPLTDADGWLYGDNKWEGQSNKGGLGKYTRYRKWTRVAVVFEEVEQVSPGEIGIKREEAEAPVMGTFNAETSSQHSDTSSVHQPDSPLRQRLRNALHKGSQ